MAATLSQTVSRSGVVFHGCRCCTSTRKAVANCAERVERANGPLSFHLRQVSVMFALHKRPCCSDPRVRLGERSGHTSSISGDHRRCCAAWSREPSGWVGGWMDWNSSGCGCGGGAEGWQQLLCADITYSSQPPHNPPNPPIVTAACESPSPKVSQTSSG